MDTHEVAWLAGFIDGEGCITSYPKLNKSNGRTITVNTQISSTDRKTLEFAVEVMGRMGVQVVSINDDIRGGRKSNAFYLAVNRAEDNITLLETLEPFLVTKKVAAQWALIYLRSRRLKGTPRDARGRRLAVPYSSGEVHAAIELKKLSNRLRTDEEVEMLFDSVLIEEP